MGQRVRDGVAGLNPGYAGLVMATGIVSTGLRLFGWHLVSVVLLVVAGVALAVLVVAYGWRVVAYPRRVLADAGDPGRAFGFFTLVAAPNVVGVRLALDGHVAATAALVLASVPVWLVLTYGVPSALLLGTRRDALLAGANGSWFLWVVGTETVAEAAATVAKAYHGAMGWLAPLAVVLWATGVLLYLTILALVVVGLLTAAGARTWSPTYWISMGATAITVFAAAKILAVPATVPVLVAVRPAVTGTAFVLWAFGTWLIPLLLLVEAWRHLVRRTRGGYQPAVWSVVFPLGMYAAASASFGRVTGLGFMVAVARVGVWVGVAAWLVVAVGMTRSLVTERKVADEPLERGGTR